MRAEVEQALQTLQQGQPDRLERALTLRQDTVFPFSMRVCGQRESAEDTMQETLLKAVRYHRAVAEAILKLPPPYRLVLVLHDMEGLSTEEVARVLGVRKGTVRVRLHRARVYVRNELAKTKSAGGSERKSAERRPRRCKELLAALSDYLDGALDDRLCEKLEKHMEGCQPCQAFLDSLEQTVEECRRQRPARLGQRAAAHTREAILGNLHRTMGATQGQKA